MDHRVALVITQIKDDLRRELSPAELARGVNLSAPRLQHLFKLETGVTIVRYRQLLRLKRARHLLETSLLSIKEIRAGVGINERGHFGREFKRLYGSTPSRYRMVAFASKKKQQEAQQVAGTATEWQD